MASKLALDVDVNVSGADKLNSLAKNFASGAIQVAKWGAIVGGAVGAAGFALGQFASDQNEAISKLNVVFPKSGKAIEKWASDSAEAFGLSETAAVGAVGTFGNLFRAMKIGEKPAADMSKTIVGLSADLASFNNLEPEEVLEKLRSGISGESEPLKSLGVNINETMVKAKAMELGFKEVDGQLTESAKAQARYALILEQTKLAQGDFKRTSGGMANQQRILAATFNDALSDIGKAFTPIIEQILPILTDALKGFASFIVDNMPTIKGIIEGVATAIGAAFSFLADEVIPRVGAVFTWLAENIFPQVASSGGIISDVVTFLSTKVFPVLLAIFEKVVNWVVENWPTISSVFGQVFGAIANAVKVIWPIVSRIAEVLFPVVLAAATVLFKGLDKTFKLIGGIFEVVGKTVDAVVKGITLAWTLLSTVTTAIWNGITATVKGVMNAVIDVINGFFGFLNGLSFGVGPFDLGPVHIGAATFDPFNIGLIPHLAEGGIIDRPTLALLGESGPEAVVPLSKGPVGETHFHSHIEVRGEEPFIHDEAELVRANQRVAFLAGF